MSGRLMLLAAAMGLLPFLVAGGCRPHAFTEEAEHRFPAHKPADYPAAVERLQHVHQEILDGPLVARKVHATREPHGRSRDQDHLPHGDTHQYVRLDALQEMGDLVRWLPDLAADSDIEQGPWNQVYSTANQLEIILADASSRNGDERRATYLQYESEVHRHLRQLIEIKQLFPTSASSSATDESA